MSHISNAQTELSGYQVTKQSDHVDKYFDTTITDPYHWLENDTSQETTDWVKQENQFTHDYLMRIPYLPVIREELSQLWNYEKFGIPVQEGKYLFYARNNGLQNQSVLYIKDADGKETVLLDPNTLAKDGTVAIQSTAFSKNQKYFAYAVSASGSDWQEIHIIDPVTHQPVDQKIEYVKFTEISWKGDEGFFYSGYEKPKDEKLKYSQKTEFQKVYYHKVGTPVNEDKVIYEDVKNPLRYVGAGLTEDEHFLMLAISEGTDGAEIQARDMTRPNSSFRTIVPGFSHNAAFVTNTGSTLYIQTNENAPNYKVVGIDFNAPEKQTVVIKEDPQHKLESVSTAGNYLFASYLNNATSEIVQYDLKGKKIREIKLPGIGTASGFGAYKPQKETYYSYTSFTVPSSVYKLDLETGKSEIFAQSKSLFDPNEFETRQVLYPSKDGTQVPLFITMKKGTQLNGTHPAMLYAYGGFNISITPTYSPSNMFFLLHGGIYCVANIRGGGEKGEKWHQMGMKENKQNVFDDFIAAAEYLIKNKYTSSEKLAIRGRSNGGLLIGACMTQRPDLYAVAIPQVGVMDMLRYHKFTVGWGWVPEYGSSDKEEQFQLL